MAGCYLGQLGAWDAQSGAVNVVIETAKGSRNKFKYEPATGGFALSKVLPAGMAFPYDFGFVPSTTGDDGDPLDVLVLMDEPAFAGCRIPCRLIGVIEGEQTEDGKTERNDRLVAVAAHSHDHGDVQTVKDLNENLLKEIEHFFTAYHDLDGKRFRSRGTHGPRRATKLVQDGVQRCGQAKKKRTHSANGRHEAATAGERA